MKRFIIGLVAALICVVTSAAITVTMTMPIFNTDGSALTDLTGGTIYWGDTSGGPYPNSQAFSFAMPGGEATVLVDTGVGDWFVVARAVNSVGIESLDSNEFPVTVDPTQPGVIVITVIVVTPDPAPIN